MSSKRGECQRKRPQRHQNSFVFKNDLYDKSERIKKLNAMNISEVCQKCHDVIEWKIKYRKYKALSKPRSCTRCNQRTVKKAYHVMCRDCAVSLKQCAKCMKSEGEGREAIIPAGPSDEEKLRLSIEMKQMVKSLPERKRRTFMRFMKGKKKRKNKDGDDEEDEVTEPVILPTRDELLMKIEKLKLGGGDEQFFDGIIEDDESFGSDDDFSSDEEEIEEE